VTGVVRLYCPHQKDAQKDTMTTGTAARSITITLEGVPDAALRKNKQNRGNSFWHKANATKDQRQLAGWLIAEQLQDLTLPAPVYKHCEFIITQYWCGTPLDHEGLAGGTGAAKDAYMDLGVIADDSPKDIVVGYHLRYVRVKHMADRQVEITCREVLS
jgi:hypothetical protein